MNEIVRTFFNVEVLIETRKFLLIGLTTTLQLIGVSLFLALGWGLALSVLRNVNLKWLNPLIAFYITVLRALPILVLLLVIYYALPFVGIELNSFMAATMALGLCGGAYYAEIFRAGIEAVGKGQGEAARSLGLNYRQMMQYVVLPQGVRVVLPPLTTNTLEFMKSTVAASVVALPDILHQAVQAQNNTFNATPLMGALGIYIVMCFPIVQIIRKLERKERK